MKFFLKYKTFSLLSFDVILQLLDIHFDTIWYVTLFLLVIVLSVLLRYMDSDYLPLNLVSSNSPYIVMLCGTLASFYMSFVLKQHEISK